MKSFLFVVIGLYFGLGAHSALGQGSILSTKSSSVSSNSLGKKTRFQKTMSQIGTLKKKEEKVINKTLSPAEQQRLSSQKWSFILSSGALRSLDEYSDYGGSLGGSAAYRLNQKMLITTSLGYEYLFYKRGGNFLVNEGDPRMYGLTDLRVGLSLPRVVSVPKLKSFINISGGLALPTSYSSQTASQFYAATFTASMLSFVSPKFLVNSYVSLLHAAHEYAEANATGTHLNSPLGLRVGATLSYNMIKDLTGFIGYDFNSRYEYGNGVRNIQSFSSGLQYALTSKIYLSGAFFWRDQFVTNDSVFDDDKSYYSLSIDYFL